MRTKNGKVMPVGWTWCWTCGWPLRASHYKRAFNQSGIIPEQEHIEISRAPDVHGNALPSADDIEREGLQEFIPGWNLPQTPSQPQSQVRKQIKKLASSKADRKPRLSGVKKKPAAMDMHVRACIDEVSRFGESKNKK